MMFGSPIPGDDERNFVPPCALCCVYTGTEKAPRGRIESPGIGYVCADCKEHVETAAFWLRTREGIAAYPLPDHMRNNR